jgi:RNA polymerase sigma factor (sigma-70 family)
MTHKIDEGLFTEHLELASKIGRSFPTDRYSIEVSEQEALIALWNATITYDPAKGDFGTYAAVVIRNHLRNFFNKAKRENREITALDAPSSGQSGIETGSLKDNISAPNASPLLETERNDIREALKNSLDSLTQAQREALQAYAEGQNFAEIAREKGVSKAAVRQMVQRAAEKMQPEIRPFLGPTIQFLPERERSSQLPTPSPKGVPLREQSSRKARLLGVILPLLLVIILILFGLLWRGVR